MFGVDWTVIQPLFIKIFSLFFGTMVKFLSAVIPYPFWFIRGAGGERRFMNGGRSWWR
jgi:hypothetical protein